MGEGTLHASLALVGVTVTLNLECRWSPDLAWVWPTRAVRRQSDSLYLDELDAEISDSVEASNSE